LFERLVSDLPNVVSTTGVLLATTTQKANLGIPVFGVKLFLDSAGLGRKVVKFRGKETVFTQGDPAKNVMYTLASDFYKTVRKRIASDIQNLYPLVRAQQCLS
jgi:hypothetical protein